MISSSRSSKVSVIFFFPPFQSMTLKEALKHAMTILKQVMEEKLSATNVELATVTPEKLFHMFTTEEVEYVLKDL